MYLFPLLAIRQAIAHADLHLSDVVSAVTTVLAETAGHYPPQGTLLLANLAVVREKLARSVPPLLKDAMAAEQSLHALECWR